MRLVIIKITGGAAGYIIHERLRGLTPCSGLPSPVPSVPHLIDQLPRELNTFLRRHPPRYNPKQFKIISIVPNEKLIRPECRVTLYVIHQKIILIILILIVWFQQRYQHAWCNFLHKLFNFFQQKKLSIITCILAVIMRRSSPQLPLPLRTANSALIAKRHL